MPAPAAISSCVVCTAAKAAWLNGVHQPEDAYKVALCASAPGKDTKRYDPALEIEDGKGYQTGGKQLEGFFVSTAEDSAFLTWNSPTWKLASFAARGMIIYNSSKNNAAIAVADFGEIVTSKGRDFSLDFNRVVCIL